MGGPGRTKWWANSASEVMTRRELMSQLMVLLGGRAAEKNTFGEPSTRAEDDLEQAWDLAKRMVNRWGMSEERDDRDHGGREEGRDSAPDRTPEREAKALITRAEQAARSILADNKERLTTVSEAPVQLATRGRGGRA